MAKKMRYQAQIHEYGLFFKHPVRVVCTTTSLRWAYIRVRVAAWWRDVMTRRADGENTGIDWAVVSDDSSAFIGS